MPFAQINGFRMHYRVTGQGPPLVLAHGLMGSIAMSDEIWELECPGLFEDAFTVINYDARGHGQSGFTTDPAHYSWFGLAEDMYALLCHLDIRRAHVGGGSLGAATSLALALVHPRVVDRLVLITPPPLAPPDRTDRAAAAAAVVGNMLATFARLIEKLGMEQAVEVVVSQPPFLQLRQQDPEHFDLQVKWMKRQNGPAIAAALRGLVHGPPLPVERFAEIEAPALIIAHPDDPLHPLSSVELLKSTLGKCEVFLAPSSAFYRQQPEEVARAVRDFLSVAEAA